MDVLAQNSIVYMGTSHKALDITDRLEVMDLVARIKPSIVLNAAAWTNVDSAEDNEEEATRVNGDGAAYLAEAARQTGARLIHVSTDYVFDGSSSEPYDVDVVPSPANAYGRSKLAGENAVLEIGEGRFPVVRTSWLFSQYGQNLATTFGAKAMKNEPVQVVSDQIGQPTSARNLAEFILQISTERELSPVLHGTNSGSASRFDFVRELYSLLGADVNLVTPVPHTAFELRASRPMNSVLSHENLVANGITPMRDWKLGLTDCAELLVDTEKS